MKAFFKEGTVANDQGVEAIFEKKRVLSLMIIAWLEIHAYIWFYSKAKSHFLLVYNQDEARA